MFRGLRGLRGVSVNVNESRVWIVQFAWQVDGCLTIGTELSGTAVVTDGFKTDGVDRRTSARGGTPRQESRGGVKV